ncbi:aldo/keto reductase [Silvibacterium sp.]|uniref:aldo/keto reductase n=1 Tax=Silvibacterium sp. TaxID=1964179 RepID=UPI0039E2D303
MTIQQAPLSPVISMANGLSIPQLGLGTWPMRGKEAADAVRNAIEIGYRHVDTAEAYENEDGVGAGIRAAGLPREQIFVTTKFNKQWHSRAGVRQACEASLKRLGLEYIDMYLIHWPNPHQDRYVEAFEGILELVNDGLVRSAGVSNFKPAHLERLFAKGLKPQMNQIQLDPYRPRPESVKANSEHGIVTESWSPLDRDGGLLKEAVIAKLAEELGRTKGQVVLRWHVQKGYVTVPKSGNPQRQFENLDIFGFTLSEAQVAALDALRNDSVKIEDSDVFGH